jgi:DNA-binding winged helix-turn-helix (wHTH) protein
MAMRFGDFVLEDESRQLLRGGAAVHLEPKAFELLLLLLRERPRALSKQAIHRAIWADTHVSESSLAGLILDLRVALGDDPAEPRFIRTVRGYGYAFCSATSEANAPEAGALPRWSVLCGGREIPLPEGSHVIGRGEGCRIRLASVRASRRHALLVVGPDGVTVEDLGSRNGTWVGGRRLDGRVGLEAGAEIRVVNETILLLSAGHEVPTLTDDERPSSE